MSDYIRKQDAIYMLQKHAERLTHQTNIGLSNVRSGVMTAKWLIEDMSTADVRKNVYAKKVIGGGERDGATCWFECSHCHGSVDIEDAYCKHCGAVLEYEK